MLWPESAIHYSLADAAQGHAFSGGSFPKGHGVLSGPGDRLTFGEQHDFSDVIEAAARVVIECRDMRICAGRGGALAQRSVW